MGDDASFSLLQRINTHGNIVKFASLRFEMIAVIAPQCAPNPQAHRLGNLLYFRRTLLSIAYCLGLITLFIRTIGMARPLAAAVVGFAAVLALSLL